MEIKFVSDIEDIITVLNNLPDELTSTGDPDVLFKLTYNVLYKLEKEPLTSKIVIDTKRQIRFLLEFDRLAHLHVNENYNNIANSGHLVPKPERSFEDDKKRYGYYINIIKSFRNGSYKDNPVVVDLGVRHSVITLT